MKRLSLVVLLAFALVLLYAGVAYANFGPHGGYSDDTDACAGCHRAHTSFSPITWSDGFGTEHSALLVSSASTMQEFCYACHGDSAPGASTNVESGIFDAGPSAPGGTYVTNSTLNAGLNGGGFSFMTTTGASFNSVTSQHECDPVAPGILWGDGNAADTTYDLTCTDCHDPHGSSNYRLLKDSVNGHTVGGYDVNDIPSPYVVSAEANYPANGWLLHEAGAGQMATYTPNYTNEEYKWLGPNVNGFRSMSAWCSACHERYSDTDDTTGTAGVILPWDLGTATYDYRGFESYPASGATNVGARARHRHPVNISIAAGNLPDGLRALQRRVVTDTLLPLEQDPASTNFRGQWDYQDYLGCLTCHVAHGTSVTMTGWADSSIMTSPSATVTWYPYLNDGLANGGTEGNGDGVNPTFSSALLRANNRGVCERCHNK